MKKHGFVIAADRSSSGKTTITLSLISSFVKKGYRVAPFKCGPDYIDTFHLSKAAKNRAYNLDSILMDKNEIKDEFRMSLNNADIGIVEGVMGLFDGIDHKNFKASSYDIASILKLPIFLVVDSSSSSFSISAVIKGFETLSRNAKIKGVILNNTASPTHEKMLRDAIEYYCDAKVIGALPKIKDLTIGSRHLGIQTALETDDNFYSRISKLVDENINLDELLEMSIIDIEEPSNSAVSDNMPRKIACLAYDKAFCFYYNHNIDVLKNMGFDIRYFSILNNETVEGCDFVYLGGGYPELYAERLSYASAAIQSIREHIEQNRPLLAECGGMMFLTKGIFIDNNFYEFCGVFDAKCRMSTKRSALGYVKVKPRSNLFFLDSSESLTGHEFHYSFLEEVKEDFAIDIEKITANRKRPDGFVKNRCFASYTHFMFSNKNNFIKRFFGGVE